MRNLFSTGLLALTFFACNGNKGEAPTAKADPASAIALVGQDAITPAELQAKLAEQPPYVRSRYDTLPKKKEFVENLVRFELLAQEARRRGLDKDPEVQSTLEKVLVQRLVRVETEKPELSQIPDEELRKAYDANLSEFVRPERIRVSHLFLAAPKGDPARAKKKTELTQLLAQLKGKSAADPAAFETAARARSDDQTSKAAGGDLGLRTRDELSALIGPEVAEAAFKLQVVGELTSVVESDKGLHLLRMTGRQAGHDQPFELAKTQLQQRLGAERRAKAIDSLVAELRTKNPVTIQEKVLEKLSFEAPVAKP
jgi:parvulin-like peptidyl-prolyl isomerase